MSKKAGDQADAAPTGDVLQGADIAQVNTADQADVIEMDKQPEKVEAFVLRDCGFGHAGDVVSILATEAEAGAQHGMLDLHPDAIKAAKAK